MTNLLTKKMPVGLSGTLIVTTFGSAGIYLWLNANPAPKTRKLGAEYCITCHSDAKTLQAMKDKRGDDRPMKDPHKGN